MLKNYCWLWTKKVTNFKAHTNKASTQMGPNFGPNFGPAPSIKIEVQTHFDSIWLYPFSWMFSLWLYFYTLSGCHILIEKSAIFITKMQFLSLEDITLQFLKNRKEEKRNYSKQQKCYTTSLRILSPKTERIFCRLVLITVSKPPT